MPPDSTTKNQRVLQKLLRDLRVDAGLRQADVAEILGVPQSTVSKYEAGERRLDVIELREVCRALGISLSHFATLLDKALSSEGL